MPDYNDSAATGAHSNWVHAFVHHVFKPAIGYHPQPAKDGAPDLNGAMLDKAPPPNTFHGFATSFLGELLIFSAAFATLGYIQTRFLEGKKYGHISDKFLPRGPASGAKFGVVVGLTLAAMTNLGFPPGRMIADTFKDVKAEIVGPPHATPHASKYALKDAPYPRAAPR